MALKVNKEYGVTIGGTHYPLGATVARNDRNGAEVDALIEKGYLAEVESQPKPTAPKVKGGK